MIVIPAIDLIDGKPVRLYKGDYGKKEQVASSASDTAEAFVKAGAGRIHIVDLDGAKSGRRINHELIARIAEHSNAAIEVGGGIRTKEDIDWYLNHSVSYVILGTAALQDEIFLQDMVQTYQEKIIVSLDCDHGYAKANGWLEGSQLYFTDFARHLAEIGVQNIVFTDIARDGTLSGPNIEQLKQLRQAVPEMKITASGGISSMEDLAACRDAGCFAAITGKAVYSGKINLKTAIAEMEAS